MAYINSTVSILALNMTELNKIIKSQRQSDGQKNHNPTICCLQETYLRFKNTYVDNKTMEKHFFMQIATPEKLEGQTIDQTQQN